MFNLKFKTQFATYSFRKIKSVTAISSLLQDINYHQFLISTIVLLTLSRELFALRPLLLSTTEGVVRKKRVMSNTTFITIALSHHQNGFRDRFCLNNQSIIMYQVKVSAYVLMPLKYGLLYCLALISLTISVLILLVQQPLPQ